MGQRGRQAREVLSGDVHPRASRFLAVGREGRARAGQGGREGRKAHHVGPGGGRAVGDEATEKDEGR